MAIFEARTTHVSLYGRFADAFTRQSIAPTDFNITLEESGAKPICKNDGSFAFIDLEPRPTSYKLTVQSRTYRSRQISANFTTPGATTLARDGEDELYVTINTINPGQHRISFDLIPFLPSIRAGAPVIGQSGFTTALQEPLEGEDVNFAVLNTVTGLSSGNVLRIIRSDRLLLRAGPYYLFTEPATVLSARIVENSPSAKPITGAKVTVNQINGVTTTTILVGGVELYRVQLAGDSVILGPLSAVESHTNLRGEALLDFPGHLSITNIGVQVNHPEYFPLSQTVAVTAGEITRWVPQLTPI